MREEGVTKKGRKKKDARLESRDERERIDTRPLVKMMRERERESEKQRD